MGPQMENNFEEDDIGFELDTDIGLPPLAPSLPNGSHTLLPPSVLGEEEDNIVLPIPNRNDQNHSGPIYSQEGPSFAEVQSAKWAAQKATFKEFCEELVYTLASKSTGYTKLDDIKADLNKDSGWIPDRVVYDLGFQTFENFMNSEQVTRYVEVKMYEGQPCYVPRNTSMFSHIRDEQLIADDAEMSKEERAEREKYSRALLPQNCEQFIKGKKTILKLLYELGGDFDPTSQRKGVLWQQIQQKYREETGKELAGEELKKMFQRDKALKIISTLFAQEIEILETTTQGQFYLRFKRPYEEIKAKFEETLRLQREGAKSLHSNRPVPKFADKCVPTGPRYPNVDPELFTEEEEKSNNNSGIATDHKRNKFDLPGTNDQVAGKKQKLADFMGPPTLSNAPTSSSRIDWDDGNGIVTSVPIYQGEGNSGKKDGRINSAGSSKNTKVGYTTRINGEYTDSSSEESDDTVGGDEFGEQRKPTKPGKEPAQTAYQFSDAEESVSNERKDFQQHVSNSRKSVPDQIGTPKQQQTGVARPKFQSYAEKVMATRLEQRRNAPDNAETTIAHSAQVTNRQRMESTTDEEETGVGKSEFNNKHVQKREVRPQIVGPRPNNTNTTRTVQSSMAFGASSSSIGFSLMDNVNELVRLADKFGVAHETRVAEGSFIFRKNDEFLVLTECTDEKIRISWHKTGRISRESYFMKTNTSEIFVFTIGGILYKHFGE